MTVRQLLANLDAAELMEWQAFFLIEQDKNRESPEVVSENIKIALER